jgi:hypothetical protein
MFVLGSRTRRPPSKSKDVTYDFQPAPVEITSYIHVEFELKVSA